MCAVAYVHIETIVCLPYRQDSMVAEIVAATQQAVAMASGKKEAAAAAADAFEAHMDLAVNAGWAYVQLLTFRAFWQVWCCRTGAVLLSPLILMVSVIVQGCSIGLL